MTVDPVFDPLTGSVNPVGSQSIANSGGTDFILVLRDAMGGMGFIGPFGSEDDALDYVKQNGINGIYWVLVTELQSP